MIIPVHHIVNKDTQYLPAGGGNEPPKWAFITILIIFTSFIVFMISLLSI